ncbi:MAG TPA: helix-turn-helix domain-containing protein [Chitinivibrionales bacterium]|nr:helix-turn-helix domain-containing protein [Chitinivibrionales bacterium]
MPDTVQRNLDQILAGFERNMIEKTLRDTRGNQSEAARILGISKRKVQYKTRKYRIDCRAFKNHHLSEKDMFFPWQPSVDGNRNTSEDFHSLLLP